MNTKKLKVTLAIVAVLAFLGSLVWHFFVRDYAANVVDSVTKGTPLEGSGAIFRKDNTAIVRYAASTGDPMDQALEDRRIKKSFVADLAAYLAAAFVPSTDGGGFLVNLMQVNQHCANLLDTDPSGGKAAVLQYAFQPPMLKALYNFYVGYFLDCLKSEAAQRWSKTECFQFYMGLSQYLDQVQGAMQGVLRAQELDDSLQNYEEKAEICEIVVAKQAVADYDLSQLGNEETEKVLAARQLVIDLKEQYQHALDSRDLAKNRLVAVVREKSISALNDDAFLFLVLWMKRRLQEGESDESMWMAIELLQNLVVRLEEISVNSEEEPLNAKNEELTSPEKEPKP
ncbi:MAG: hypothetical protein IK079_01960, partial [Desulfovibrio sp.]|nr:hypothetical protein [Desulfovibrio sp.]